MATLVIRNPDGSEQEQELVEEVTIGRADGNDLVLVEGGVSRKHARFFVDEGKVFVEDVGSANGTWVDGERIEGPTAVTNKATVVVGDYEVVLKVGTKQRPSIKQQLAKGSNERTSQVSGTTGNKPRPTRLVPVMKPASTAALAERSKPGTVSGPQLRGLTGSIMGTTFPLRSTMVIGRVSGCDVQIDDDSVSRRHAEASVEGREVVLRDLGSANGTTVNGAPILEDTTLSAGDIIQFGVVELVFETTSGARAAGSKPVRTSGRPRPRRGGDEDEEPAVEDMATAPKNRQGRMDPGRKRLYVVGASVLAVLFIAVGAKVALGPGRHSTTEVPPGKIKKPVQLDPAEEVEKQLKICRTYSSPEDKPPDWARAEEACQKCLELEPIHRECNELMKTIQVNRACESNLKKAIALKQGSRSEESLESFEKIKPDCRTYLNKALEEAKEPVEEVKKAAGNECKQYASNGLWENALKRCEVYSRLACQVMKPDEIYPPGLKKLNLEGGMGRNDWRPSDPNYLNFLKARARLKPGEPMWTCPDLAVFKPPPKLEDPGKKLKDDMLKWYPDPEMGRAVGLYLDGQQQQANVPLQKIIETMSKAALHDRAKALLLDISNVFSLYNTGVTQLQNEKPELAERPFRDALALDEKLLLADLKNPTDEERKKTLEQRQSFVRKSIVDSMSTNCYQRGKTAADRKDFLQACLMWKLGGSFSRANIDLLKALSNVCTKRAAENFKTAESCDQIRAVLKYAVDGDGYKEKVDKALEEQGCK